MPRFHKMSVSDKFARANLKADQRQSAQIVAVSLDPPTIFIGSREYDRRAVRVGEIDAQYGKGLHENPFMMPDNREAWEKGWHRAR